MIETDVLIVGSGPAGSAAGLALSTYGVPNVIVNKYRWQANTPRAHITNQRLGRSLTHLIDTITGLNERGIGFKSITEAIDTTTSGGKLIFHIFGALAEFERDIIRERTNAGLTAARARGKRGGRPKLTPTARKVALARALYADKTNTIPEICKTLNISRATLYRYLGKSA
ncbi:MAG: recombinase family protein [Acetobacteraceae bacterium]|nr:recombinase family protein [Acetobacteraceae bacterium]MBV8521175.1 recombinase family protein [Acetobacteraceae bacterium]